MHKCTVTLRHDYLFKDSIAACTSRKSGWLAESCCCCCCAAFSARLLEPPSLEEKEMPGSRKDWMVLVSMAL